MAKRQIIKIDEEKCNGCGLCVPNCKEGAIQIVNGKARLVSEVYCDGLGACLGHCPQGAITIEEREAKAFDERKAMEHKAHQGSELGNWPVQLRLVPAFAAYLNNSDLLISADCVPFAYADFHKELLKGKVLIIGCPKLDDVTVYAQKLKQIFENKKIKSVTYAHMEVPCCFGLMGVIEDAIRGSGKKIPFKEVKIGIKGERLK